MNKSLLYFFFVFFAAIAFFYLIYLFFSYVLPPCKYLCDKTTEYQMFQKALNNTGSLIGRI